MRQNVAPADFRLTPGSIRVILLGLMATGPETISQGQCPMKYHPSITEDRVLDACERHMSTLDNPGFCLACGEDAEGCEPDARGYRCEYCGQRKVYGAEECLLMGIGL